MSPWWRALYGGLGKGIDLHEQGQVSASVLAAIGALPPYSFFSFVNTFTHRCFFATDFGAFAGAGVVMLVGLMLICCLMACSAVEEKDPLKYAVD